MQVAAPQDFVDSGATVVYNTPTYITCKFFKLHNTGTTLDYQGMYGGILFLKFLLE
jgi:hypothetical protein